MDATAKKNLNEVKRFVDSLDHNELRHINTLVLSALLLRNKRAAENKEIFDFSNNVVDTWRFCLDEWIEQNGNIG